MVSLKKVQKNIIIVQGDIMQRLIENITNYLNYLKKDCGLNISVHFDEQTLLCMPPQTLSALLPYNSHTNPYCLAVKKTGHHKCVISQKEILKNGKGIFFRVCHAGVYEYIHTLNKGFIAVSGFRQETPPEGVVLNKLWKTELKSEHMPIDLFNAVIPPLAIMLEQMVETCSRKYESEYNLIVQFLNEYHTNISLDDLCRHFGRSRSHISHLFKKTSGKSIREYCNSLKLEDAKKLLEETERSITEIAFDTGFNDTAYFINIFRNKYGITPLQYRKTSRYGEYS